MDHESTVVVSETLKTSVNTAVLRIPALHLLYLSGLEWPGVRYILGTVRGAHPFLVFNLIDISSPHSGGENFTL